VALEIGLWRVDSGTPVRVGTSGFPPEAQLEKLIESDPTILGEPLLVVGRQVPTASGKFIDLLAVGADGTLYVLGSIRLIRVSRSLSPLMSASYGEVPASKWQRVAGIRLAVVC
jgi:hypothetical protein